MIAKTLTLYFMSCVLVYICYDVLRKTSLKEKIEIGKKGLSVSLLLVVGAVVCAVLSFVGNLN